MYYERLFKGVVDAWSKLDVRSLSFIKRCWGIDLDVLFAVTNAPCSIVLLSSVVRCFLVFSSVRASVLTLACFLGGLRKRFPLDNFKGFSWF